METLKPRPSMRRDLLSNTALVKGRVTGVALVFDCVTHLAHTTRSDMKRGRFIVETKRLPSQEYDLLLTQDR